MISDPMASQSRSLLVGLVLALVVTGGCGILALIRPQGAVGDAKIVLAKESGALYVHLDDVLHPVTGLASARLVVGEAAAPVPVKDGRLNGYTRGPEVGIVGAPAQILGPRTAWRDGAQPWLLCDRTIVAPPDQPAAPDRLETSVIADPPASGADDGAVLVRRGEQSFLLLRGLRVPVDPSDPVTRRITGLDGSRGRPVSAALLNAFRLADPLAVPQIPGRGGRSVLPGVTIGEVVRVADADRDRLYAVLADGLQPVGAWAADLIRAGDPTGAPISTVAASTVAAAPTVRSLPVRDLPDHRPQMRSLREAPTLCAAASADGSGGGTVELRTGPGTPAPGSTVVLAGADAGGDALDAAYVPPGTGEYVVAAEPGGERRDGLYYVSDSGVRYGIPDVATARTLGLAHQPRPVPWSVLSALPAGPDLSRRAAAVTRDGTPIALSH
ncbi:type VII secretion system ESX-4 subunit EccB4 [Tsukamurella serpentis]